MMIMDRLVSREEHYMKRSFALASMITVVAACLLTVMFLAGRGNAQQKPGTVVTGPGSNTGGAAAGNQSLGRFQIAPYVNGVVVMDTTTGHCWSKNLTVANAQWQDRGTPSGDRN
jgi:hypothetical protein